MHDHNNNHLKMISGAYTVTIEPIVGLISADVFESVNQSTLNNEEKKLTHE